MGLGDWREKIVTPSSNGRTWVVWESGYAQASKKELVPLAFFMDVEDIHPVYGNIMAYIGDGEEAKGETISRLCAMLINMSSARHVDDDERKSWKPDIQKHLKKIQKEKLNLAGLNLFSNEFHSPKVVEELLGKT